MRLATRYFIAFAGLATSVWVTYGILDAFGEYRENAAHVGGVQRAEARVVATRIAGYLDTLAMQLHDVNALPWSSGILNDDDRRRELHRLLKLNPALYELRFVSAAGRERNFVSRISRDRAGGEQPWPLADLYARDGSPTTWYGPVYFREGSTPYVSLVVKQAGARSDLLVAEVDLRYVTDLIAGLSIGRNGIAYVVDSTDHLVAHPNLSFVHRKVNLANVPQVIDARAGAKFTTVNLTRAAHSPDTGTKVLTSAASVATPRWLVFVEQPFNEVMEPVRASIYRTIALIALFLLTAIVVSRWLATRLTRPIVELERGATRIASGDLSARVTAGREDEVQSLGTEFNRMAENLGRSYAELEGKVQLRTQELAEAGRKLRAQAEEVACLNDQLRLRLDELAAKKDEAERANAAKTRFLAAASHDLRQPMQAISLLVEVLRERMTQDDPQRLVEKVQASVQALESLFVSLLDISRLDAGAVQPDCQEFCIDSLLNLLEANFFPQALAKNLQFSIVHSRAVVRSDPALLERILSNLVSNAIRYTAKGRILVGCRRRGDRLRILVIDTGSGIPAYLQTEIFEEFFQVANPERDRSMGLGLGLSIVKRTAEILGHPLIVRSLLNHGSTFGVEVPLRSRPLPAANAPKSTALNQARFAGTFVLVVDDDHESRFAIETLCAQWGCHVVGAGSSSEALEKLTDHLRSPELIIADYRLSQSETGVRAVELVRQRLDETIPAIIITGDMSVRETDVAARQPIALVYKPINAGRLWEVADKLLPVASELDNG